MKKVLEKYLPLKFSTRLMKNTFKEYFPLFTSFHKQLKNREVLSNINETAFKKNALLSYILTPFKGESLSHTNFFEVQSLSKVLLELGYNVDVIHFENKSKIDLTKYDLLCGFGDIFQHYFEDGYFKAKTIYYGAGMHVCHQNNASLLRVKDVYAKKGVWLGKSARFVEKTWSHQTTLVDGIIALGNNTCVDSYRKYYNGVILSLHAPFYQTKDVNQILQNKPDSANKSFLWFGGSGLIHKGLDLLLDYFSKNQDLTLHICGPIAKEKDFVKVYKKELFQTRNILNHDFINIEEKKFSEILELCSFVILPSCSEGGAPSVLTAIGNGGLIPIITKETAISTGYEIIINTLDEAGIENAINRAISLNKSEVVNLSKKNLNFVLQHHSQDNYKNNLRLAIENILEEGVACEM